MKKWISFLISVLSFIVFVAPTYAMETRSTSNLKGIDVSHWDGNIDWAQARSSGVQFAYLKATEGSTKTDNEFANYVQGARVRSIAVGAYHYAKPTSPYKPDEPVNQAKFFVNTIKSSMSDYGDIMPVLDLEENGGLSQDDLVQWVRAFINTVEQSTNRQVMLYISEDFLSENQNLKNAFSDVPLWVSYWDQYYGGQIPPDIAGWNQWTAWQYSSQGTVPGIPGPVDLNAGPISLDALKGYLTTSIKLQLGSKQALINGKAQTLDVAPFTVDDRTMVPIRFISETLGSKVDWNPATQQVTISKSNVTINLTIGQKTSTVNGSSVILDAPAQISQDRTFVPLRFISENLGLHVEYQSDTQAITIS